MERKKKEDRQKRSEADEFNKKLAMDKKHNKDDSDFYGDVFYTRKEIEADKEKMKQYKQDLLKQMQERKLQEKKEKDDEKRAELEFSLKEKEAMAAQKKKEAEDKKKKQKETQEYLEEQIKSKNTYIPGSYSFWSQIVTWKFFFDFDYFSLTHIFFQLN